LQGVIVAQKSTVKGDLAIESRLKRSEISDTTVFGRLGFTLPIELGKPYQEPGKHILRGFSMGDLLNGG
jgi:hypothetical protein